MAVHLYLLSILRQVLAQPLAWLAAAALVAAWWLQEVSMPLGLVTRSVHRSTAHYELALLGGLAGVLLALGPCARMRWTRRHCSTWNAWLFDVLSLFCAAALMGAFVLVPAEAFQRWQFADFHTIPSAAALAVAWLHMSAMGTAIVIHGRGLVPSWVRAPSGGYPSPWIGPASMAFAVVLIPAMVPGTTPLGRALIHAMDPARMLRATFDGVPSDPGLGLLHWGLALVPVLGWGALGAWLAMASQERPIESTRTPHALRDPR